MSVDSANLCSSSYRNGFRRGEAVHRRDEQGVQVHADLRLERRMQAELLQPPVCAYALESDERRIVQREQRRAQIGLEVHQARRHAVGDRLLREVAQRLRSQGQLRVMPVVQGGILLVAAVVIVVTPA